MENDEGGQRELTPLDDLRQTCSSMLTPSSGVFTNPFHAPVLLQCSGKIPHFKRAFGLLRCLGGRSSSFFYGAFCWCSTFCCLYKAGTKSQTLQSSCPFQDYPSTSWAVTRSAAHHNELHQILASTKAWPNRANSPLQPLHLHHSSSLCKLSGLKFPLSFHKCCFNADSAFLFIPRRTVLHFAYSPSLLSQKKSSSDFCCACFDSDIQQRDSLCERNPGKAVFPSIIICYS